MWIPILVGNKNQSLPNFVRKHIMFGIQLDDKKNVFFINIMLILGKFFFHKCKCMKTKPYFSVFKRDFIYNYFPSLEYMKSKKAQKLIGIIRELDLFEEE